VNSDLPDWNHKVQFRFILVRQGFFELAYRRYQQQEDVSMKKWLIATVSLISLGLAVPALALTDEEKAAKRAEWESLTQEEQDAKKAERQAKFEEHRATREQRREDFGNLSDEEQTAARAERRARFEESGRSRVGGPGGKQRGEGGRRRGGSRGG
jgi:hypothetical protein